MEWGRQEVEMGVCTQERGRAWLPSDAFALSLLPRDGNYTTCSSASSGQRERWALTSCLLTDSPTVFVVLQLNPRDGPAWVWGLPATEAEDRGVSEPAPPSLCISPKIHKGVADFYRKSSQRDPPRGQRCGGWRIRGVRVRRHWASSGYGTIQPSLYLN